ncbi:nucleotidyl transferase AbiEii/AbiGii toxin family protein [Acinetobacter sp. ESBL14]|uniref:nucleotidyl transferase AbiEii/AbiGii toxin family protein n=1 Tax=Acinetobacter sp. ESBL14 TaxID=3077329 RepID=UPI002FC6E71E
MNKLKMMAYEGLIRRFALSHTYFPFVLKGSFLTRQYFPKHIHRKPIDLDWVCLKPLLDKRGVQAHLNDWMHYLTTVQLDDGIRYDVFPIDSYWWELDYVMSEDFPTVSTAFHAWVNEQMVEIEVDVSFNLDVSDSKLNLNYQPLVGPSFKLKQTPSLATQIAWKLHQCIVNPRYKDIFDLTWLLQHAEFKENIEAQIQAIEVLSAECHRDEIILTEYLRKNQLIFAEARRKLSRHWEIERNNFNFVDLQDIPKDFNTFWNQFTFALIQTDVLDLID